jgi:hypothetical protein
VKINGILMAILDFESDQFLQLLTDAMRQGPGSAAWRDAADRLRDMAPPESSSNGTPSSTAERAAEFQLLLTARQHLESGRSYREIRAGPGFTRAVLEAVELERQQGPPRIPSTMATLIAVLGALTLLVSVAFITYFLFTSNRSTLQQLTDAKFQKEILTTNFSDQIPAGFKSIGSLSGGFSGKFRPPMDAPSNYAACGLAIQSPLSASQTWQIEVNFHLPEVNEQAIPEVLVSGGGDLSNDHLSPPLLQVVLQPEHDREWMWRPQVALSDGSFAATGDAIGAGRDSLIVDVAVNKNFATVDCDGKRIYQGPSQLGTDGPRFAGVRILRRGKLMGRQLPEVLGIRILSE